MKYLDSDGSYVFTDDEKNSIEFVLQKYPHDRMSEFIKVLERVCEIKKIKNNYTAYIDIKDIRSEFRIRLLSAVASIDKLMQKDNALHELSAIIMMLNDREDIDVKNANDFDMMKKAEELQSDLRDFVSKMDDIVRHISHSVKSGRKNCNNDKFYSEIALLYKTYLEMPTTSNDCAFAELISTINEFLHIKPKDSDPSRAVRQAIRDVRNGYSFSFLLPTISQR